MRERLQRSLTVVNAPKVRIAMHGGDEARAAYQEFTARHPRFRISAAKKWGVALLRLPDTFDHYLAGHSRVLVRQKRRLAQREGFHYAVVSPREYLDDILEVNRSAPSRQGRPMPRSYLDHEPVKRRFEGVPAVDAILDSNGRLRAYTFAPLIGDAFYFSVILGHAHDLEQGTMYLLVSEVVRRFIEIRGANGSPTWAIYDTFWGASPGLVYFKERLGFRPFTVDWVWTDPSRP